MQMGWLVFSAGRKKRGCCEVNAGILLPQGKRSVFFKTVSSYFRKKRSACRTGGSLAEKKGFEPLRAF